MGGEGKEGSLRMSFSQSDRESGEQTRWVEKGRGARLEQGRKKKTETGESPEKAQ